MSLESENYMPEIEVEKPNIPEDLGKIGEYPGQERSREVFCAADDAHTLLCDVSKELETSGEDPIQRSLHVKLVRLLAAKDLSHESSNKNPQEQTEIALWEIYKYFRRATVGRRNTPDEPGCSTMIDAIHANPATPQESLIATEDAFPEVDRKILLDAYTLANVGRKDKLKNKDITRNLLEAHPELDEEIASSIIDQVRGMLSRFETRTSQVVMQASKSAESSCLIPRLSRVGVDLNEDEYHPGLVELGYNALEAERYFVLACLTETSEVDEKGRAARPFLHLSLHGKVGEAEPNEPDIVIANGMQNGRLACDPEIARWVEKRVAEKMQEMGLVDDSDNPLFSVGIATDAMRLSGSEVNVKRRWGNGEHNGLGENYQHVQIETTLDIRKNTEVLSEILATILEDFPKEFPDTESLKTLQSTEKDELRKEGKLVFEDYLERESDKSDYIWLNQRQRAALGITTSDSVVIGGNRYNVRKATVKEAHKRLPVLPVGTEISLPLIIEKA